MIRRRRVAVNRLIVDDETFVNCIVEICDGVIYDYFTFDEEQPFTEWVGGTWNVVKDAEGKMRAIRDGIMLI
ncbi:MAG: hypothetical protein IJ421_07630 [Prevotella sp.]|nr:hypothetical protein [Prevotella sp.]MBQ8629327.1 hypothetical protein [Prevotella sp.]